MPIDKSLGSLGLMNEGILSTKLGLPGIPAIAEELIISRDIELLKYTNSQLHITGVSTAKGIALIEAGKKAGLALTCSVTPYHLYFNETDLNTYDTLTVNKTGEGAELLAFVFNTERPWVFKQTGSGAGASLVLQSQINSKSFIIQSSSGNNIASFYDGGTNSSSSTISNLVATTLTLGNAIFTTGLTTGTLLATTSISSGPVSYTHLTLPTILRV